MSYETLKSILNKRFLSFLGIIFFLEIISFLSYFSFSLRQVLFFLVLGAFSYLCIKDIKYGIFLMLGELFISSKGYLFYFDYHGFLISIRIAMWAVIMSVWFAKLVLEFIKKKKPNQYLAFTKSSYYLYFTVLFVFIFWGVINGFLNNNGFKNIFFDFNGWLYFSLIFPLFSLPKTQENIIDIGRVFLASILWMTLKTYFLLFIFSHNIPYILTPIYSWVRKSGVGEITKMEGGFYRIFFQSHIYSLLVFFIFLLIFAYLIFKDKQKLFSKRNIILFLVGSVFSSMIIISFSRSFWVGAVGGLFLYICLSFYLYKWKKTLAIIGILTCMGLTGFALIVSTVKFPYPDPLGGFNATKLLTDRASEVKDEAAVSSRWNLLPKLWEGIEENFVLGQGFGKVITYKSNDPRVLEENPDGDYSTYAFEWGWLDVWLKLGFLGAIAYLVVLAKMFFDGVFIANKNKGLSQNIIYSLSICLAVVVAVNVFTPYVNHPLGIGFFMLSAYLLDYYRAVS